MTPGEHLIGSLPLKAEFYDRHEWRAYLRMVEVARRLVDAPELLERGRDYLEKFVRGDPHQKHIYQLWRAALALPVEDIARHLLADDERGAALRESAPVFVVISAAENRQLWASQT